MCQALLDNPVEMGQELSWPFATWQHFLQLWTYGPDETITWRTWYNGAGAIPFPQENLPTLQQGNSLFILCYTLRNSCQHASLCCALELERESWDWMSSLSTILSLKQGDKSPQRRGVARWCPETNFCCPPLLRWSSGGEQESVLKYLLRLLKEFSGWRRETSPLVAEETVWVTLDYL